MASQQCSAALQFRLSRLDCCCGAALGLAWSHGEAAACQQCPGPGTTEYASLCEVSQLSVVLEKVPSEGEGS